MGAQVNESGGICHKANLREPNKSYYKDLPKYRILAKLFFNTPVRRLRHIDDAQLKWLWYGGRLLSLWMSLFGSTERMWRLQM